VANRERKGSGLLIPAAGEFSRCDATLKVTPLLYLQSAEAIGRQAPYSFIRSYMYSRRFARDLRSRINGKRIDRNRLVILESPFKNTGSGA